MLKKENLPYYIFTFLLFILLKVGYRNADTTYMVWILGPINYLFSFFTSSESIFIDGEGYFHKSLNIIINKSCSGGNFFILTLMMLILTWVHYFKINLHKILLIIASIFISYIFTILVNTSRIIILSKISNLQINQFHWLHEAVGSFIYLFFLILLYQAIHLIHNQTIIAHEKSF